MYYSIFMLLGITLSSSEINARKHCLHCVFDHHFGDTCGVPEVYQRGALTTVVDHHSRDTPGLPEVYR